MKGANEPIRVMHSPTDDSNPFFSLLVGSLPPRVRSIKFSGRAAVTGRFDVLHVHWPERLVRGNSPLATARMTVLTLALLVVMRARRIPLVRTLHNSVPHDPPNLRERLLLRLINRSTTYWVRLTDAGEAPAGSRVRTILHGDYRGHYSFHPETEPQPDLLLYFGRIRPYKGVEELVATVAESHDLPFRLRLAGRPTTPALDGLLRRALTEDDRLSARLEFIPEDDLVAEIEQARAVCLPYRDMENSGAMLLALTAHRPVIVPNSPTNALLAEEIGPGWVIRYSPPIDRERLEAAWLTASASRTSSPDLSARAWPKLSAEYAEVYAEALELSRLRRVDRA
jgi:beta-1,4-mannosyltransferase